MNSRAKFGIVTCLTFVRFPLVLLFFAGALVYSVIEHHAERPAWLFIAAFISLVASAITDLFDGYFARRWQVETKLGAHADPLMDKFFYLTTLPLLVFVSAKDGSSLPHAVFLLILTIWFLIRDQWVTFLRSIGSMYQVSGCAHWSGKLRTFLNFPLICCIYYFEEAPAGIAFINPHFLYAFEVVGLLINFISLGIYTHHYWPYLVRAADFQKDAESRHE